VTAAIAIEHWRKAAWCGTVSLQRQAWMEGRCQ
jgi:hypothetical protein